MRKLSSSLLAAFALILCTWIGANLYICWKADEWISNELKKNGQAEIHWKHAKTNFLGRFIFNDVQVIKPLELTIPELSLQFSLPSHISIKADSEELGELRLKLQIGLSRPHLWRGIMKTTNLQSEKLFSHLKKEAPVLANLSGKVDATVEANGSATPGKFIENWTVEANGDRLAWKRDENIPPLPFSGTIKISPKGLQILSANVNSVLHVKGNVQGPWSAPEIHLTARATNASVPRVIRTISPGAPANLADGTMTFFAQIDGAVKNPTVQGNFSTSLSYAKIKLPPAQGTFQSADKKFTAVADFAGGRINLSGAVSQESETLFKMIMKNVSLTRIAQQNEWSNVTGVMDSQLQVAFKDDAPNVVGDVQIERFQWGRYKDDRVVSAKLLIDKHLVRLTADALIFKASIVKAIAHIDEFHLNFGRDSRLAAIGDLDLNGNQINLSVNGQKIPPDLWPPLVERYPEITGAMNIHGTVQGELPNPSAQFDIAFNELRFIPNGGSWSGDAKLLGSADQISLQDIHMNGGYAGELTWSPRKKVGITTTLSFTDADPRLILDVMKSSVASAGQLNGQTQLSFLASGPVGVSSISWSNGAIGTFKFDRFDIRSTLKREKIYLDEVSLVQGARALHGQGEAIPSGNGWDFTTALQLQKWGNDKVVFDGETNLNGSFTWPELSVHARLRAPLIWANEYSFENLDAQIKCADGRWYAEGGASGGINFNGRFDQATEKIDVFFQAKSAKAEMYLAKLIHDPEDIPKGEFKFTARVGGTIFSPETKINVESENLQWRQNHLSGSASVSINASTITIQEAQARSSKGGSLVFSGQIGRSREGNLSLSGKGKKLDIQSIFHLLRWPVKMEGKTDGTFEMSGPFNARRTSIAFNGHQNGFGPFSGEGKIAGAIIGENGQWDLAGIRAESGSGYVVLLSGSRIYTDRSGTSTMQLLADSRNLRAGVLTFFGGAEVTGHWKSKSDMGEELKNYPVDLEVFARSLWINQYVLDGNVSHLTVNHGEIEFSPILGSGQQISGKLFYKDYPVLKVENFRLTDSGFEKCFLDGLIGPNKWDYELRMKRMDASILRSLFDTTLPIEGVMDAHLQGRGSLNNPDISGDIVWENGHLDLLPLDQAQCKVEYKNGMVEVTDLRASKKKGYILTGSVKFAANPENENQAQPEIDLTLDKGDLTFLQEVWPEISKARGSFTARFKMANRSWGRSISGYLSAQKVAINSAYTPNLRKGELKLRLDKNRFHVEEAKATIGEGDLALAGYVDFNNAEPNFYNLSLRTLSEKGVSVKIPQLSISPGPFLGQFGILKRRLAGASRGELLVNLILKGPAANPLLAGTIELENTVFTYPPTNSTTGEHKNTALRRWLHDFKEKLKWDISLVAGSRTWYQNELVDANVDGTLQFTGPSNEMDVNGKINTQQGSIVYSGSEFKIKNATLELETRNAALNDAEPARTVVYLKATAEKQVYYSDSLSNNNQDTIVMVVDRSQLGEIQPRFYSRYNPSLSSQRALQLALDSLLRMVWKQ